MLSRRQIWADKVFSVCLRAIAIDSGTMKNRNETLNQASQYQDQEFMDAPAVDDSPRHGPPFRRQEGLTGAGRLRARGSVGQRRRGAASLNPGFFLLYLYNPRRVFTFSAVDREKCGAGRIMLWLRYPVPKIHVGLFLRFGPADVDD
jgi:hypothetical protein